VPLNLKALQCPHCQHKLSKAEQADKQWRKQLLAREPVSCPNCGGTSKLPEQAEKLISVGVLCCLIIAPLLAYWRDSAMPALSLFALGIAMIVMGAAQQQLQACDHSQNQTEDHHE